MEHSSLSTDLSFLLPNHQSSRNANPFVLTSAGKAASDSTQQSDIVPSTPNAKDTPMPRPSLPATASAAARSPLSDDLSFLLPSNHPYAIPEYFSASRAATFNGAGPAANVTASFSEQSSTSKVDPAPVQSQRSYDLSFLLPSNRAGPAADSDVRLSPDSTESPSGVLNSADTPTSSSSLPTSVTAHHPVSSLDDVSVPLLSNEADPTVETILGPPPALPDDISPPLVSDDPNTSAISRSSVSENIPFLVTSDLQGTTTGPNLDTAPESSASNTVEVQMSATLFPSVPHTVNPANTLESPDYNGDHMFAANALDLSMSATLWPSTSRTEDPAVSPRPNDEAGFTIDPEEFDFTSETDQLDGVDDDKDADAHLNDSTPENIVDKKGEVDRRVVDKYLEQQRRKDEGLEDEVDVQTAYDRIVATYSKDPQRFQQKA